MTTTHISHSANTIETWITGTIMNSLGTAAWADGVTIDNTGTDGSVISYIEADAIVNFATAVVTGSGTPNVVLELTELIDGSHGGPTDAGSQPGVQITTSVAASTTISAVEIRNVPMLPYKFVAHLQNNLGVAFAATGQTFQGVRRTIANW